MRLFIGMFIVSVVHKFMVFGVLPSFDLMLDQCVNSSFKADYYGYTVIAVTVLDPWLTLSVEVVQNRTR